MKTRQTNNELNKKEKGENARDKYQVRALLSFPSKRGWRVRERAREIGGREKVGYLAALSINN